MTKIHTLEQPPSYVYEDGDCIVRVYDKDGDVLTNANAFYALCKAAVDLLMPIDDEG